MKLLAIIPARGGSKGIPDKNIIDICGKPLIQYSIEPALELKKEGLFEKVIVSTDSEKISAIAKKSGAEVPFLRPAEIADDKAKSISFIQHAIDFYEKQAVLFDAIVLLQPTSPLRTLNDLRKAIQLFIKSKNDSLITAYKEEYVNDLVMYKFESDGITGKPLNTLHNKGVRRQDHGAIYVRNGCIYISGIELIKKGIIIGDAPLIYVMDKNRSINLDTLEDLEILRKAIC